MQVRRIRLILLPHKSEGKRLWITMSPNQEHKQKRNFWQLKSWNITKGKSKDTLQNTHYHHVGAWSLAPTVGEKVKKTRSHDHHVGSSVLAAQRPLNPLLISDTFRPPAPHSRLCICICVFVFVYLYLFLCICICVLVLVYLYLCIYSSIWISFHPDTFRTNWENKKSWVHLISLHLQCKLYTLLFMLVKNSPQKATQRTGVC